MMILMLTPALACGAIMMCVKPAQAAEEMPCHGDRQQESGIDCESLMFFKDCLKVELAQADKGDVLKKPDLKVTKVFYDGFAVAVDYGFRPPPTSRIRSPPVETAQYPAYPPLYLTTQRLRI